MMLFLVACIPALISATGVIPKDKPGDDDAYALPATPGPLKDVAVDLDDERFLQITRLKVSGERLEGHFQLVSNAVGQEDDDDQGNFSSPEAVVSLSKDLGPALVGAVRFFSDARLTPGARRLLDGYLLRNGVEPSGVVGRLGNRSDSELAASAMYERLAGRNLDEIADFLLDVVRRKIRSAGHDEMGIPDQDCLPKRRHRPGSRKVFYAAGGTLKGVSRVVRAGPATARREGSVVLVSCPLRLDRLRVRYEAYGLQLSRLKIASGGVDGGVRGSPAELLVAVGVAGDGCSSASVRRLKVTPGEVRLRLAGLSDDHPMVGRVGACFADLFRDAVAPRVERVLRDAVVKTLEEFRCPR